MSLSLEYKKNRVLQVISNAIHDQIGFHRLYQKQHMKITMTKEVDALPLIL
jgi:hypothetical protein